MKKVLLTKEGYDKLVKELDERKNIIAGEIADRIEEARSLGDLSENAGYKAALEDKEFNQMRISELEQMIKNAEIVESNGDEAVDVGDEVKLKTNGVSIVYRVVGQTEADPAKGLISNESPIGAAIIGKKSGDKVRIKTPAGEIEYVIESVS